MDNAEERIGALRRQLGVVVGERVTWGVWRAFELMKVAEDVIAKAGGRRGGGGPGRRAWDAFQALSPGELSSFSDDLYERHCEELVARAVEGSDLRPGTRAEAVVLLYQASLCAPLSSSYLRAYEDLMGQLRMLPGGAEEPLGRYAWIGEGDEILEDLRRKASRPDRVIR